MISVLSYYYTYYFYIAATYRYYISLLHITIAYYYCILLLLHYELPPLARIFSLWDGKYNGRKVSQVGVVFSIFEPKFSWEWVMWNRFSAARLHWRLAPFTRCTIQLAFCDFLSNLSWLNERIHNEMISGIRLDFSFIVTIHVSTWDKIWSLQKKVKSRHCLLKADMWCRKKLLRRFCVLLGGICIIYVYV